jgi:hypothetical protein
MQQDKKMYIAAGVFLGVGLLFLSVNFKKQESPEVRKISFGQVENTRRAAIVKGREERAKVEVQNYMSAPAVTNGIRVVRDHNEDAGLKLESSLNSAVKDSVRDDHNAMPTNALDAQMSKVLANRQKYEEMTKMQKARFIEEYKRNALAMGYVIELDDKLNIVKYRRTPAAQRAQTPIPVQMPNDVDQMEEDSDELEE